MKSRTDWGIGMRMIEIFGVDAGKSWLMRRLHLFTADIIDEARMLPSFWHRSSKPLSGRAPARNSAAALWSRPIVAEAAFSAVGVFICVEQA